MLDCAAVHPPAPLCHGASPPAAAPATLLVLMMAQLWRLDPAPGARRGVRSSGIVVQLFCAPGSAGAAGRFIKVPGRLRLERGVVVYSPLIPGFALPAGSY